MDYKNQSSRDNEEEPNANAAARGAGNNTSYCCFFKKLVTRREMRLAGVKYIRINNNT